jgi:hypothetical protein
MHTLNPVPSPDLTLLSLSLVRRGKEERRRVQG